MSRPSAFQLRAVPDATVARLPLYLRALVALAEDGTTTVSSQALAAAVKVNSAKVRKDLSHLGSYGTRGVGYDVAQLTESIAGELGLAERRSVVIVGIGNLGHALARYGGFASRGFHIAALLDEDPAMIGDLVGALRVRSLNDLPDVVAESHATIGVIATPAEAAQGTCDLLVEAGVTAILNFASVVLTVPSNVDVRRVDLSVELQILSFHEQRKALLAPQPVEPVHPVEPVQTSHQVPSVAPHLHASPVIGPPVARAPRVRT